MSKAVTENTHWQARTGSYSTHGSRRGINNLGWESEEWLSAKQEREALVARAQQLQAWFLANKPTPKNKAERTAKAVELNEITARINRIRPKLRGKFKGIGKHLLDVLKENTPPAIWERHYNEALRRWNAAQLEEK